MPKEEQATAPAAEKTNREKLVELQALMAEDQADACDEALAYVASDAFQSVMDRLEEFQARTVPGSMFDQQFNNLFVVVGAIQKVLPQARAQSNRTPISNKQMATTITASESS